MKAHHGNKWMPVMYANYYGILKDVAEECGYALAVHGSFTRDLDLIAVAWVEKPMTHMELLSRFQKALGSLTAEDGTPYSVRGEKPHGRIAYTIITEGGGYIDLSIIGPAGEEK